ncbi:type cbb3 cytochrome oxidase biogenesis protein CcoG [Photobacterium aphoticum]|uniref:Type cbb3 cytochrome oxidase biogenesis protein CcoG n=1 Tax=Photobacterium aphoticum TaxID=754436 RepID=A0A090R0N9_9GAMM|nr:type cbb3 cytochrome oxidase biogenesis protein CcoG [Photobacterium aphoticum]
MENTYTLKILNKTQHAAHYQLSVHGLEDVQWYGDQTISVAAGEVFTLPISLGSIRWCWTARSPRSPLRC